MRPLVILAALLLAAATAVAQDCPPELTPTLEVDLRLNDDIRTADSAQNSLRDFKGLIIEEQIVREVTPLLLFVFFDSGSAAIPSRYRLLGNAEATRTFDESALPGGTLQKYYHVLDIVGSRMRRFPTTKIQIVGCNSEQPQIGETIEVSRGRGEALYRYLVDVWGIDTARIELLKPRGFPEARSNPKDPIGITENRRAEIRSTDWEIVRPLTPATLCSQAHPPFVSFRMGSRRAGVARRWIEVRRGGADWARFLPERFPLWRSVSPGQHDVWTLDYNWGSTANQDSLPAEETPFSFQLVEVDSSERECRSQDVEVPVAIVGDEAMTRERIPRRRVEKFLLIQFKFDSPDPGLVNGRIIREDVASAIRQGARVVVTRYGYTDDPWRSWSLSRSRQRRVIQSIQKLTRAERVSEWVGESFTGPLYAENGPEHSVYNRAILITVENPVRTETE